MKILVNNYNKNENKKLDNNVKSYPRKLVCGCCGSELEYEKSDLRVGALGCIYLDCPLCGEDNLLDDHEDAVTLTKDNVEFPTHFWHTSAETGAVDVCTNERVREYINKAIEYFRKNKEEYSWCTATGNMHIEVKRFSGDEMYEVLVTDEYYDTYIPFEKEDY